MKKVNQKGFSIIEVLIVLAIAGLIMLIVFLAVPALRRNSANSGRQSDASKISSAVTDCLSNHNGNTASCVSVGPNAVDVTNLSQLSGSAAFVSPTAGTVGAAVPIPANVSTGSDPDASNYNVNFKAKCDDTGTGAIVSSNTRDFIILYNKKTSNGILLQCIGS